MKDYIKVLLFFLGIYFLSGCNNKATVLNNDLEIIFENDTLFTYSNKSVKDTVNIIRYMIKNNSSNIYYINQLVRGSKIFKVGVYKNGVNILVFDEKGKEIKYEHRRIYYNNVNTELFYNFLMREADSTRTWLGYKSGLDYFEAFDLQNKRVFIHPNEELFFEYPIFLKSWKEYDGNRLGFANLSTDKKYFCKISISSDSLNYKNVLPRDVLKTIEVNKVKVYNGLLESKNKVPIKVLD